ncbi:MAG: dihydroorotate dehydrogenase [bacterium]|nr:dihydroorotate dehydrogenase [bacterium]
MSSTHPVQNQPSGDVDSTAVDLRVNLGRLSLKNPILVASGTFGYAREMEKIVRLDALGGILPKTITLNPRPGNAPWRTVETSAGLLNSIGLDNDGIESFLQTHLQYLQNTGSAVIVSVAGKNRDEFVQLARKVDAAGGADALELNISCPNVSGGVDFGTDPSMCREVIEAVRDNCNLPILAKLTPNVTRIAEIAQAAADGGADAVCCINTVLGMAVDWQRQRPMLGNILGGLSGPAIKPIALRCVFQVAQSVSIPIVGIGGIATLDDVMEFLVTGATCVQIGTANYYDPTVSERLVHELPSAIRRLGASRVTDVVGTLKTTPNP